MKNTINVTAKMEVNMLDDLAELIAIESVYDTPSRGAPFGEGCRRALEWFLAKARSYGLTVGESDGYCGWAEYGEGSGLIGILCHLDVVPSGSGWSYPPFKLIIEDGNLYGRGVVDDKGSAVVCLHVLKSLKDSGATLCNRIRLIVGLNEENGSSCMQHYHANCELPKFNFVPDSDFPIINSEKGIARIAVSLAADDFFTENIARLTAGTRPNVVPDLCNVTINKGCALFEKLKKAAEEKTDSSMFLSPTIAAQLISCACRPEDFSAHFFPDKIELEARGIAAHSMVPYKGENAFWKMTYLFDALKGGLKSETLSVIKEYYATPLAAERLRIAAADDVSGELTINLGIVNYENERLHLTLDLRLPMCINIDTVMANIKSKMPLSANVELISFSPNLFVDGESNLVKALLAAYTSVTDAESYCVKSGGGTYARELPNSVAFGPTFPGAVTNIHNADECIAVTQFNLLFDIYKQAVLNLDKL